MRVLVEAGAEVVVAEGDAEACGARMIDRGEADALATDDGDGLVFGAAVVVHQLTPLNNNVGIVVHHLVSLEEQRWWW